MNGKGMPQDAAAFHGAGGFIYEIFAASLFVAAGAVLMAPDTP